MTRQDGRIEAFLEMMSAERGAGHDAGSGCATVDASAANTSSGCTGTGPAPKNSAKQVSAAVRMKYTLIDTFQRKSQD